MAKYIDRDQFIDWLKTEIKFKDLSDGLGICLVIMKEDFERAIKHMPNSIIKDVAPVKHGHWVYKHRYRGGFRKYTGVDSMGVEYTITVDERYECDDPYCSECNRLNDGSSLKFCPNCGAIMTYSSAKRSD